MLTPAYDELINDRPDNAAVTRAVTRGGPPRSAIYAKKSVYYNSFLPKTVRETKAKLGSQCRPQTYTNAMQNSHKATYLIHMLAKD